MKCGVFLREGRNTLRLAWALETGGRRGISASIYPLIAFNEITNHPFYCVVFGSMYAGWWPKWILSPARRIEDWN